MNTVLMYFVGLFAGIGTTLSFLPQVIKIYKSKSVNDISPYMFMIHFMGVTLWILYGVAKNDLIIILFNTITFILCLFIFVFFIRYRNQEIEVELT